MSAVSAREGSSTKLPWVGSLVVAKKVLEHARSMLGTFQTVEASLSPRIIWFQAQAGLEHHYNGNLQQRMPQIQFLAERCPPVQAVSYDHLRSGLQF
jgi:hypothetical protein